MTNKEAITFLREWRSEEYMSDLLVEAIDRAIRALEGKRDEARWIDHDWEDMHKQGYRRCSRCHHAFKRFDVGVRKSNVPWIDGTHYQLQHCDSYCPHCGAYMINSNIEPEAKIKIKKGGKAHE